MKKTGGGLNVTVVGLDELNRKLNTMPNKAKGEASKELSDILLDLTGKSQRRAPKDTGALRGSAFTEMNGLEGTVGYEETYALIQHESMDFNHQNGEAKYLENPFKENINKYIKAIGNAVKRAVE